jgi:hypothetical protein
MNPCGSKRIHEPIKRINEVNLTNIHVSLTFFSRIVLDFQMSFFGKCAHGGLPVVAFGCSVPF